MQGQIVLVQVYCKEKLKTHTMWFKTAKTEKNPNARVH